LNIFLGWSIIGWIVALVWALSKNNQVLTIEKKTNNEDVNQLIELRKLLEDGYITSIEFEKRTTTTYKNHDSYDSRRKLNQTGLKEWGIICLLFRIISNCSVSSLKRF
jgi:hypothetical protein